MFSISFDGGSPSQIDVYNKTAKGTDSPMLLFAQTGLSNDVHTVTITNLLDSRVGEYGQMNVRRFIHAKSRLVTVLQRSWTILFLLGFRQPLHPSQLPHSQPIHLL